MNRDGQVVDEHAARHARGCGERGPFEQRRRAVHDQHAVLVSSAELDVGDIVARRHSNASLADPERTRDPRLGGEVVAEQPPVAELKVPPTAEFGASFTMSGADSQAFEGRKITQYIWTMLD